MKKRIKMLSILISSMLFLSSCNGVTSDNSSGDIDNSAQLSIADSGDSSNVYNNLTYEVINSKITITGVVDNSVKVIKVPKIIRDYSVSEIEFGAFENCNSVEEIEVPFVGENAETTSNNFFSYIFGGTSFEDNQYLVPSSLTEVTVTGNANIAQKAFSQCNFLYEINLSNDVAEIGDFAFENCENLSLITIPSALTKINNGTFWFCVSITFVAIPDRVTTISSLSFNNCSRLGSAVIPESVETIEEYAFNSCSRLEKIFFKGDAASWEAISISEENAELKLAEKYFYSEAEPTENGNYWHCVNGDIVIW